MKLVCNVMINGVETTKVLTTVDTMDQGKLVQTKPGLGKPYLMFASLTGTVIAADFEGAPLVSNSVSENNAMIQQMLADPEGMRARLTFAT